MSIIDNALSANATIANDYGPSRGRQPRASGGDRYLRVPV